MGIRKMYGRLYEDAIENRDIIAIIILVVLLFLPFVGWCMNFQNLVEYWPAEGGINNVPIIWVLSLIGVFVAPLGTIMGFMY